jgi:hypothetical protein
MPGWDDVNGRPLVGPLRKPPSTNLLAMCTWVERMVLEGGGDLSASAGALSVALHRSSIAWIARSIRKSRVFHNFARPESRQLDMKM